MIWLRSCEGGEGGKATRKESCNEVVVLFKWIKLPGAPPQFTSRFVVGDNNSRDVMYIHYH